MMDDLYRTMCLDLARRLDELVIMDEVSSNNPLGRDAATAIRNLLRMYDDLDLQCRADMENLGYA